MLGALEALEAGTTAIIDHHASPNAIEGSLDVIADACAEVGVRVVCCYEVTDRNGADGAKAGLAENERFLRAGGRGLVGAHAAFTLSDDTLDAVRRARRRPRRRRAHPRGRGPGRRRRRRAAAPTAPTTTGCSRTACTSTATLPGTDRAQPALEPEQRRRLRPPGRVPHAVALGTDGIGADMLEEFRLAFALRRAPTTSPTDARHACGRGSRPARELVPEARDDRRHVVVRRRWMPWHLAYTPGVRAGRRRGRRRGRARRPARPGSTPTEIRARAAEQAAAAVRRRLDVTARTDELVTSRSPSTCRTRTRSATACGYAQCGRGRGLRGGVAGREPARPRGDRADGRVRRGDRARSSSARASSTCWTRNPACLAATFSTLDDLAPGRVILGIGAWWDPLAAKVGIDRDQPLRAMREIVTAVRGLLANETVTFDGEFVHLDGVELDYVHQERRPKDVPIYIGATGMQMMELAGEIADGVVLNYLVSPAYNADGAWTRSRAGAAKAGRDVDDIDRPAARRVLDRRRPRTPRSTRPPARHAVPRPAAAHHEGVGRARRSCSTRSARCSPGRPPTSRSSRPSKLVPDDIVQLHHRVGHARRVPGQGRRVRAPPAARARSSTRSGRRAGDDRRVPRRRVSGVGGGSSWGSAPPTATFRVCRNPWLERRVLCYAHQGGAREGPSSTLWAMERAVAAGAEALELDVHATADGQLVVCHDATVDRTTDGTGAISGLTLEQLRRLDNAYWWVPGQVAEGGRPAEDYPLRGRAPRDRSLGVATIDEVLETFPHTFLNLDIKQTAPAVRAYEELLARTLRAHRRIDDVIVASFNDMATDAFRTHPRSGPRPGRWRRPRSGRPPTAARPAPSSPPSPCRSRPAWAP